MSSDLLCELARNVEVVGSSPNKGLYCFLEQETLPLLLSTGWFQQRIRAWFHKEDWLKCQTSPLVKYHQNQTMLLPNLCHWR